MKCQGHKWRKCYVKVDLPDAWAEGLVSRPILTLKYAYCVLCRKVLL